MREFVLDCTERYRLTILMASFHNIVLEFLRSDRVCSVAASNTDGTKQENDRDAEWKKVKSWRQKTLSSPQLNYNIRIDFYHVWINTNWKELDLAKRVARAAVTLDHVLKNMPVSPHDVETRGWKSWYFPNDLPPTSV